MMNEDERAEYRQRRYERAQACSDEFAERGYMCAGCDLGAFCDIRLKLRDEFWGSTLDRVVEAMAQPGNGVIFIHLGAIEGK